MLYRSVTAIVNALQVSFISFCLRGSTAIKHSTNYKFIFFFFIQKLVYFLLKQVL